MILGIPQSSHLNEGWNNVVEVINLFELRLVLCTSRLGVPATPWA
jgi:hypothetical protein